MGWLKATTLAVIVREHVVVGGGGGGRISDSEDSVVVSVVWALALWAKVNNESRVSIQRKRRISNRHEVCGVSMGFFS
jgi:hypothetical protein